MKLETRINPNCSECAFVIYSDKLDKKQKRFFDEFIKRRNLVTRDTPMGNISIETGINGNPEDKSALWELEKTLDAISEWIHLDLKRYDHYDLIRDESYFDLMDDKKI